MSNLLCYCLYTAILIYLRPQLSQLFNYTHVCANFLLPIYLPHAAYARVIVIVQLSGIYGSKRTESEGDSPRTRFVYAAINPCQLYYKCYISHLIGQSMGAMNYSNAST